MDAFVPIALSVLAIFGIVAAAAGVESRDGFDRDGRAGPGRSDPAPSPDTLTD